MNSNKLYIVLFIIGVFVQFSNAQSSTDLASILEHVKQKSNDVKSAGYQLNVTHEENAFFKSQLKPQVGLSAQVPNYNKTSLPVVQPDGSISFQSISQGSSSLSLFASQVISKTGGSLYLNSDLQRFDNFSSDFIGYNGIPIRIGYSQDLFAYNRWGAEKKMQPLLIEAAQKTFNVKLEEALQNGVNLYFDILIAKQNLDIAKTNEKVNQELVGITKERLALGRVSKDEMLQLEIELHNSQIDVSQATNQLQENKYLLSTFLGEKEWVFDSYQEPELLTPSALDYEELLKKSMQNRPEVVSYELAKLNASNAIAQAKSDYGMKVRINASLGLARGAHEINEVYSNPFTEQQINLSLNVPILDWGKRKSAVSIAEIKGKEALDNESQIKTEIENNILQALNRFKRIQKDLDLFESIMEKSDQRFKISNERYILGSIDITNLTLAQREKDSAKRNYINTLKSYWLSYYQLRLLTGYDIITQQNIN